MNEKSTELSWSKKSFIALVKVELSSLSLNGNLSPGPVTVACPDKGEVAINPS